MKKFFLLSLLIANASVLFAQTHKPSYKLKQKEPDVKWYSRVGLGYAVPHAGQITDPYGDPYSGTATYINNGTALSDYKYKKASMGSGVQLSIAEGYMFNKNLGLELSMNFGIAPQKYTYSASGPVPNYYSLLSTNITQHAKLPIMLIPSVVFQTGGSQLNIYTRVGIVLPINTKTTLHETDLYDSTGGIFHLQNEKDELTIDAKSSFSLGFAGALGLQYKMNKHFRFFAELSVISINVYIKEDELTQLLVNGSPTYNGYPTLQQVSPTNRNYSLSWSNPASSTNHTQAADVIPFSNAGINIGIVFTP